MISSITCSSNIRVYGRIYAGRTCRPAFHTWHKTWRKRLNKNYDTRAELICKNLSREPWPESEKPTLVPHSPRVARRHTRLHSRHQFHPCVSPPQCSLSRDQRPGGCGCNSPRGVINAVANSVVD